MPIRSAAAQTRPELIPALLEGQHRLRQHRTRGLAGDEALVVRKEILVELDRHVGGEGEGGRGEGGGGRGGRGEYSWLPFWFLCDIPTKRSTLKKSQVPFSPWFQSNERKAEIHLWGPPRIRGSQVASNLEKHAFEASFNSKAPTHHTTPHPPPLKKEKTKHRGTNAQLRLEWTNTWLWKGGNLTATFRDKGTPS